MQVIQQLLGLGLQRKAASRGVGAELSLSEMALVGGGSPKTGWGPVKLTGSEQESASLDSPKTGW